MPLVPTRILEALQFCEAHYPVWLTNATQIGLTTATATSFKTATQAARTAYDAHQAAILAARAAGVTAANAISAMRDSAGDTVRLIRAFAETQPNPDAVYTIAQIPPPATPSPRPAPERPRDFTVALNPGGTLTLKWKCPNPSGASGVVYQVKRRLMTESEYTNLGAIGVREFTDENVPSTAAVSGGVVYVIQAQRGDRYGPESLPFVVTFGIGGGGSLAILNAYVGTGETAKKKAA
jgi:hypothetical protein